MLPMGGNLINLSERQHSSAILLNEELCRYVWLFWQSMSVVSVLIRLSLFRQIRHGTVPESSQAACIYTGPKCNSYICLTTFLKVFYTCFCDFVDYNLLRLINQSINQ